MDPFGGARPVDTKARDLEFDERRKKEAPAKQQETKGTDAVIKPSNPQTEEPAKPEAAVEAPVRPQPTESKLDPIAAVFKPEAPLQDPNSFDSAPNTDPDWDFSDTHARYRASRGPRVQRYVRVPRSRGGDRKGPDTPVSMPDKPEEAEKPVEVPKTRKRAWTSEEDDKAVINHPPIVEVKVEPKVEEPVVRGRGGRGRGRPR